MLIKIFSNSIQSAKIEEISSLERISISFNYTLSHLFCQLSEAYFSSLLSRIIVTGPSFIILTSISAPNSPVATLQS